MLTDELKTIKELADEAFEEVDSNEYQPGVKAVLLSHLDEIGELIEDALRFLTE